MKIMNIYKNNLNYLIKTKYLIKKNNIIHYNLQSFFEKKNNIINYKLPFNIIQSFFEKKNINMDKLKITYLFLLTMGIITYNRYIL
jgi:hypothetical protein